MSSSITQKLDSPAPDTALTSESLVPVASRELFWRAKFLQASKGLAHLPFLFWLISQLRPRRTVTLNTGKGTLHFAACQAVDKLGIEAVCANYSDWQGKGVPDAMRGYNGEQYDEFSSLADCDSAKALRRVARNSIDLLIVDGPLTHEVVAPVFEGWPAKMSDRGVIVLTGLDSLSDEDHERLQTLEESHASLRFGHGGGLSALMIGETVPEGLSRLSQLDANSAAFLTVERIFSRLGASHVNEWTARDKSHWARQLSENLQKSESRAEALDREKLALSDRLDTLETAYGARQRRVIEIESEMVDLRAALEEETRGLRESLAGAEEEVRALRAALSEAETAAAAARTEAEAAGRDLARAREEARTEIEALTGALEEERRLRAEAEAQARAAPAPDDSQDMIRLTEALARAEERAILRGEENRALTERLATLERESEAHAETVERLNGELVQRSERAAVDAQAIETLKAETARLRRELKSMHEDRARLEHSREELLNSTSWRVTGPLRRVGARLRRPRDE